jgi:hypothetical protein
LFVVRNPDRTKAQPKRITTFADPLAHDLVRGGVNPGERYAQRGWPYRVNSVVGVAAGAGYAHLYAGGHLPALLVDPADCSIALIECPDRSDATGQEPRLRPNMHRLNHLASSGVYRGQNAALNSSDPNNPVADNGVIGPGRYRNHLTHSVYERVDSIECAVFVRHDPHAVFAGCDAALRACRWYRKCGPSRILTGVDPELEVWAIVASVLAVMMRARGTFICAMLWTHGRRVNYLIAMGRLSESVPGKVASRSCYFLLTTHNRVAMVYL